MSKAAQLALLSVVGLMSGLQGERPTQIRSYKIEQKKEETQLSKQKLQKMKGKKNRKNRGRNRVKKRNSQDTALYASLRR